MNSRNLSALVPVLICASAFVLGCDNPPNRHTWILPKNEKIEYYEGPIDPGFTAHFLNYVDWTSETRGTNKYLAGNGGGFRSVTLHLNQNQTVAWITGRYAGGDRQFYVAVLDLLNFKIIDGDCMWQSESNSNPSEIRFKREVEQSSATATVVEEQKK
jgi:hypothetical protein